MSLIDSLALAAGTSPDGIKLLLGILAGYPISLVFKIFILQPNVPVMFRHLFSALMGISVALFCYGRDIVFSLAAILATYLCVRLLPRPAIMYATWLLNFGSLLLAYFLVSSATAYDIDWTMAQCVLCLRMIAFAYDRCDALDEPNPERRGRHQRKAAIDRCPNVLEYLGFAYHWSGFLVGPQYGYNTYNTMMSGPLHPTLPLQWKLGAMYFLMGTGYMGLNAFIGGRFPTADLDSERFLYQTPWFGRLLFSWVSIRGLLCRYAGTWCLTHGAVVLCGLGAEARPTDVAIQPDQPPQPTGLLVGPLPSEGGRSQVYFNTLLNFNPWRFETATCIDHYVHSFNINTNAWVKEYVYKRLRFLGNRNLSLLGTLFFLALWHGFAPGYFSTFFLEFVDQLAEPVLAALAAPVFVHLPGVVVSAVRFIVADITITYALVGFMLKSTAACHRAYWALGYFGHLVPVVAILGSAVLRGRAPRKATGAGVVPDPAKVSTVSAVSASASDSTKHD